MTTSPPQFAIVSGAQVSQVLAGNHQRSLELTRQAYLLHGRGEGINPNSYFLRFGESSPNRIIALLASLGGDFHVAGVKWISSFPGNVRAGLPRASGVIILNDLETGYPVACLEGSIISAIRTACSAALAAERLRPNKVIQGLTLVGNGLIARHLYQILIGCGWDINEVHLFDKDPAEAHRFRQAHLLPQHSAVVHDRLESALDAGDLIAFTTTASEPYVPPNALSPGAVILHLSLRDLSIEDVLNANNIVDSVEHVLSAGTSLHRALERTGSSGFINGTIYDLLNDAVDLDVDKPTIVSPFGLGVLDLALAALVCNTLRNSGDLHHVPEFFTELER